MFLSQFFWWNCNPSLCSWHNHIVGGQCVCCVLNNWLWCRVTQTQGDFCFNWSFSFFPLLSSSFLFFPLLSFLPCFSPVSVIYSPSLINFSFPASHAGLFFFFFCQLEVFQPFFLSLDLPYSVVRGEEVAIKAVIFNYLNETQEVPSWFYLFLFVCLLCLFLSFTRNN